MTLKICKKFSMICHLSVLVKYLVLSENFSSCVLRSFYRSLWCSSIFVHKKKIQLKYNITIRKIKSTTRKGYTIYSSVELIVAIIGGRILAYIHTNFPFPTYDYNCNSVMYPPKVIPQI